MPLYHKEGQTSGCILWPDKQMPGKVNLQPILQPKSIAILGASTDYRKPNGFPLFMLLQCGYEGEIYPVNPNHKQIAGLTCYPTIGDVPAESIDLAIVGVAAPRTIEVLQQCAEKGVKGAVVFTSGFAEAGGRGRNLQDEIFQLSSQTGIRIVGPNCVGVINRPQRLWASFSPPLMHTHRFLPHTFNFISQSGFFGILMFQMAAREGLLFDQFVSVGNEADLGLPHFLDYMTGPGESEADLIACYIEGIKEKDGDLFKRSAEQALDNGKLIAAIKVGQTEAATKAASSHTAAMTGTDEVYEAFFKQKGIIRTPGSEQMVPLLKIAAAGRLPAGKKTAVISDSGGGAVLLAEKCQLYGLELASFEKKTVDKLKEILPFFAATDNPVDLTGQILTQPDLLYNSLEVVENDPNVQQLVLNFGIGPEGLGENVVESVSRIFNHSRKPMIAICWPLGEEKSTMPLIESLKECGLPIFHEMDDCIWALGMLTQRMEKIRHYEKPPRYTPGAEKNEALKLLQEYRRSFSLACGTASAAKEGRGLSATGGEMILPVSEYQLKKILSAYRIQTAPERLVHSKEEALQAAEQLGYPVVLKTVSPRVAHKTDIGGLILDLESREPLERAFGELAPKIELSESAAPAEGILVQKMLPEAVEFIVGVKKDPVFGPVLLCGLGGIFVEVFEDVSLRVAPISRRDAFDMLQELRAFKVLRGTRGRPAADIEALIDVMMKVSRLAVEIEGLEELDINPLMVYPEGSGTTAVDAWGFWRPAPLGV